STNETLEDSTNLSTENTNQRQLKDTIPKAPEN
ncbi:MAG: hypothetical protein ACI840_002232, partial [Ulvibacter sp.]